MDTIGALFVAALTSDPARPLVTYYDDATGERTELSGETLANWVAKTANLLVYGVGLAPGGTAGVLLPAHWQTAAVLLGCWSAGIVVDLTGTGDRADVTFAAADRLGTGQAGEIFGLALAALAAPMRPAPPPGVSDFVLEVRQFGDQFRPVTPVTGDDPAVPGTVHRDICRRAADRAAYWNLRPDARVLVDGDATPDPVDWLLAPLSAGASIVLSRNVDAEAKRRRLDVERITAEI